jgi:hypothetical protein
LVTSGQCSVSSSSSCICFTWARHS